jgi:hypothetical protein
METNNQSARLSVSEKGGLRILERNPIRLHFVSFGFDLLIARTTRLVQDVGIHSVNVDDT